MNRDLGTIISLLFSNKGDLGVIHTTMSTASATVLGAKTFRVNMVEFN